MLLQAQSVAIIVYGVLPYLWRVAGDLTARWGYGPEYEVWALISCSRLLRFAPARDILARWLNWALQTHTSLS